ncbi:MAG TPA: sodium/proline symporter, partial [Candidatus Poseidoniaceae archaeon]|nr:sodium/proline symporter [Candidatus Poseidoniaceae archaeon]
LVSTIGQLVAWIWLYKYIQKEGSERNLRSLSSLVSSKTGAREAEIAAILSVFFLAIYAAAQLTAGGVALNSMLDWPETTGILIGFVLVVAYCYAGGIRASIWTDAAQSSVMIVGSTILCVVAMGEVGGLSGLHNELASIDSSMVNIYPSGLKFGATLWIAAFFLGGLGVAGQPQVVSRVMTLKDDSDRKQAMVWFFVWQTPFIALMFIIGLACRAIFDGTLSASEAESGLPMLAQSLNPILGGVILASIFAATMSTADSQVLACTAAITDDIKPEWKQDHGRTKQVTLVVAALATGISLVGQQFPGFGDSVFALVVFAVYGLGGIFVPLILIRMAGYEPDSQHTISMMVAALLGVFIWTLMGFGEYVFPSVPGMGAAFAVHFSLCWFRDDSSPNPLGRYSLPTKQFAAIGAVAMVALVGGVEYSYYAIAPDASDASDKTGTYSVVGEYSFYEIAQGSEYIEDGGSVTINASSDDAMSSLDGMNIVGVLVTITHEDTETINGPLCAVAEPPQDDTVEATISHADLSAGEADTNSFDFQLNWHNSSLLNTNVSNMTKADIESMLDGGGIGFGTHDLVIGVTVQNGGGLGCNSNDDGQDVSYTIELVSLDYSVNPV